MRRILILIPLVGLLAAALWFAVAGWEHLGDVAIPAYGWLAIIGGSIFSLLVGGGLMALLFFSNRRGYDDLGDRDRR